MVNTGTDQDQQIKLKTGFESDTHAQPRDI